jgi:hypothetical protein
MTTRFRSGTAVESGYSYDVKRWTVAPIAKDGERLPEGDGEWMRIPTAAALLATPVLGGLFLVFLPLIGFVIVARAATRPVVRIFGASAKDLAATVTPGWKAGEAHFTGRGDGGAAREGESRLDRLQEEIDERRRRG